MELALVAPVLLTLVVGVIDIGRAFYYREQVINAARQALRVAVQRSQQSAGNTACGSGGTVTTTLAPASGNTLYTIGNAAALENSSNGTASGSSISGATLTVTWHCRGGNAVTNSTNLGYTDPADSRSDAIEVTITYPMQLVTPLAPSILGSPNVSIKADLIGRAEY